MFQLTAAANNKTSTMSLMFKMAKNNNIKTHLTVDQREREELVTGLRGILSVTGHFRWKDTSNIFMDHYAGANECDSINQLKSKPSFKTFNINWLKIYA